MSRRQRFISLDNTDHMAASLWIAQDTRAELTMTNGPGICVTIVWDGKQLLLLQQSARVLPAGITAHFTIQCRHEDQPPPWKCVVRLEDA